LPFTQRETFSSGAWLPTSNVAAATALFVRAGLIRLALLGTQHSQAMTLANLLQRVIGHLGGKNALTTGGAGARTSVENMTSSNAIAFVLLFMATVCSAQDSREADYYLNNPEKYEGKKITVDCTRVVRADPRSWRIKQDDLRVPFYA
jgi:hypothetical protein